MSKSRRQRPCKTLAQDKSKRQCVRRCSRPHGSLIPAVQMREPRPPGLKRSQYLSDAEVLRLTGFLQLLDLNQLVEDAVYAASVAVVPKRQINL